MIIKIFKSGTYPQGRWDMERVQRLVDSYDPENDIEAPCVIGHSRWGESDESEFSHGWVRSLSLNEQGEVWADVEASEDLRQWVATRKLGYVSIGILADDERDEAKPPRLAHVAFLGRTLPQIKTTKLPPFYSEFGINEKDVSIYSRKIKIKRDLINVETFAEFSGDGGGRDESGDFQNVEKEKERIAGLEKRNSELEAALKAERQKSSEFAEKKEKEAVLSRIERLIGDGRLHPESKDKLSEAALAVEVDKRESFFDALDNSLGVVVSEGHFAEEGAAPKAMSNDEIRAFAAERKLDFETAVGVLQREGRMQK